MGPCIAELVAKWPWNCVSSHPSCRIFIASYDSTSAADFVVACVRCSTPRQMLGTHIPLSWQLLKASNATNNSTMKSFELICIEWFVIAASELQVPATARNKL